MELIHAVIYGIVQGVTEWLPISSTAHLRIVPALLGQPDPGASFTAVIQLGTVLAVLIYFAKDLWNVIGAWARSIASRDFSSTDARIGWGVFFGSIPIVVIGFLFKDFIKSDQARSLYVIAATLIVMGIVMVIAERVGKQERSMDQITLKDGIVVGLFQCLSLIPGMSRSGSTISGALFAGLNRETAARYSFLLSVPSITAAGLYELKEEWGNLSGDLMMPTIVATVVSFVVGYATIAWLIKYIARRGIAVFVVYRIVLGIALIVLIQMGVLSATSTPQTGGGDRVSQEARAHHPG